MARIFDQKNTKYAGETRVYEALEKNLPESIIVYYNREVDGHEFDFCVLVKNLGLIIIEVKGWNMSHIVNVKSPDEIVLRDSINPVYSPKKQANGYRFVLLNMLNDRYGINPIVVSTVAYPFMTEMDYKTVGLNIVSEPELTLFSEDLESSQKLSVKLGNIFNNNKVKNTDKMSGVVYDTIRRHFENNFDEISDIGVPNYSELRVYSNIMTVSDIDDVVINYTSGTKQIIFVNTKDELEILAYNINKYFEKNRVSSKGNNLVLNTSDKETVVVRNNKLSVFNFEAYCVEGLDTIIDKNIIVINGKVSVDNNELIKKLASKATFNYQQYIVEHADCDKHIQVRAGAGTGKTYSMISRISYICSTSTKLGVINPAEEIAMLTFTDEAAINMRNRLKAQFKNYFILTQNKNYLDMIASIERMRISTIHSFAKEIIQRTSMPLGIGTNFSTVSGSFQRRKILRNYLSNYFEKKTDENLGFIYNLKISLYDIEKYILSFIDKCYNKGIDLRTVDINDFGKELSGELDVNEIIEEVVKKTEIEYSKYLLDNNQVSLSEYMIYLEKCINDESFNANLYHYKYLFIDEFQDVDDAQINIFKSMNSKISFKFFIVGDLKQSIYRFRGATMDAFTKMGCDNKNLWNTFTLNINYRSDKRLLEDYETVFSRLGQKNLIPYNESDELRGVKEGDFEFTKYLEGIDYESDDANKDLYDKLFKSVADRLKQLEELSEIKNLSVSEKTIAILVRKNYQVVDILRNAKERNILVESDKNSNLYTLQSTIDFCKLTSALCNPYNAIYLYDLVFSNNISMDFSPLNLIDKTDDEKLDILINCLDEFYKEIMGKTWSEIVVAVQNEPTLKVLRNIYEATKPWKKFSESFDKQTYYRENYELLFESLARLNRRNYLTLESINESLMIAITSGQEAKSRDVIENEDRVRVICVTVHASKGLEYDTVIIPFTQGIINEIKKDAVDVSCIDGKIGYCLNFRMMRRINEYFDTKYEIEEIIKEESRVLYVALTRAINRCIWFGKKDSNKYNWQELMGELEECQ